MIGRWWDKETEIDFVAFNEKENRICFGESKWTNDKIDVRIWKKPAVDIASRGGLRRVPYLLPRWWDSGFGGGGWWRAGADILPCFWWDPRAVASGGRRPRRLGSWLLASLPFGRRDRGGGGRPALLYF